MGIFADYAPLYVERGFRVIPTGKKDGKKPLIRKWQTVGTQDAAKLAEKFPDANIAVIDGDKVTRIDVDDPDLMKGAIQRFGDTPVKVQTPSGGYHLWYAANGERRKIGIDGQKIDVLGKGGYGVAPPSVCPGKGKYRFIEGSLEDTDDLPVILISSLPVEAQPVSPSGRVEIGSRTNKLFDELRKIALQCETIGELAFMGAGINEAMMDPPLERSRGYGPSQRRLEFERGRPFDRSWLRCGCH